MDKTWNEVLVMRFCIILFSLKFGIQFSHLLQKFCVLLDVTFVSAYLVIFYVCVILETKQLCCDLKESHLVAWFINNVLQQFIENTVNKKHSWQIFTLHAEESLSLSVFFVFV